MDKIIIFIISAVILVGIGFWGWQSGIFTPSSHPPVTVSQTTTLPEGIVLFYGDGCPHCKDVEDFISKNGIDQKVKITRLEVWYNKDNQKLLGEVAQKCGIKTDTVGVPFLYDPPRLGEAGGAGKCYIGEIDVPAFLKIKAGIK